MKKLKQVPRVKRTRFRKRVKKEKVEVVSRKDQGDKWQMIVTVPALEMREGFGGAVSSSWIARINWYGSYAKMLLMDGKEYYVYITGDVMQSWYYSPSKGTFFNERIKDNYLVARA